MSLSLNIPAVETDRLILRGYRESDLDAVFAFNQGERSHWVGGPKTTRHECWRVIIGVVGHWALRGYGLWMVEEKATGKQCGGVGIINHVGWREPELGWHVFDGFEGKGIAYEAALAARTYAAQNFNVPAPISYIRHDNHRSIALAERLGATLECEGELTGKPCLIYRHPVTEAA
ncbi:GNAT family N-acetyltransferase [Shimia sp. Alg240-R146]|uniref:GNAT family N-acetyltransferase n=1 Tax=Shimia sp. Alg240-R146 TaxID=2993449 RepID=UPI0022E0AC8D|nr:GNAT family N-acetyltransferase [Shimia sp. Alg240-R146]